MNILIIDDEPKIRHGLTHLLGSHADWNVIGAFANAVSALNFLYESDCDVIISDIRMPGMSGLDMIQQIRGRNQEIPIIILSGYGTFSFAQRAIELGVRKYLTKPTNPAELIDALELVERERTQEAQSLQKSEHVQVSNLLVLRAIEHLERSYADKVSLREVAGSLYISPNYLSELFRRHTGSTFSDYLLKIRMEKAAEFLLDVSYKVSEIAEKTGFQDGRYFSSTFKKYYGLTPLEYRNSSRS